jgi:hypothetical protein
MNADRESLDAQIALEKVILRLAEKENATPEELEALAKVAKVFFESLVTF